jgi:hypothetical protein
MNRYRLNFLTRLCEQAQEEADLLAHLCMLPTL